MSRGDTGFEKESYLNRQADIPDAVLDGRKGFLVGGGDPVGLAAGTIEMTWSPPWREGCS